jgi:hypothetical protein
VENAVIEGVSGAGILLESCVQTQFLGGTSEFNGQGVVISALSHRNTLCIDLEGNESGDILVSGVGNTFNQCLAMSWQGPTAFNVRVLPGACDTVFSGGFLRQAHSEAGSSSTLYDRVQTSNHPSLGFTGTGYTATACRRMDSNMVPSPSPFSESVP